MSRMPVTCEDILKIGVSPANLFESTKVLMATPQGRRLGYHTTLVVSVFIHLTER